MAVLYIIKDWAILYENNRTRELKSLNWLPLPNRQDGDGYTQLLDHQNGASHLGLWTAVLQVASRCDPRGTLLRSCKKPHDFDSLSRITRVSRRLFDEAFPRLIEIGWIDLQELDLKEIKEMSQDDAVLSQDDAALGRGKTALNGMNERMNEGAEKQPPAGQKKTEKKDAAYTPGFTRFWDAYPQCDQKVNKRGIFEKWKSRKLEDLTDEILAGLARWKTSKKWRDGYVPLVSTWINQSRWESPTNSAPIEKEPEENDNGFVRKVDHALLDDVFANLPD